MEITDKELANILRSFADNSQDVNMDDIEEAADRLDTPSQPPTMTLVGTPPHEPLTKLEQFTMAAMQGFLGNDRLTKVFEKEAENWDLYQAVPLAMASVRCAQATIAQLEKET